MTVCTGNVARSVMLGSMLTTLGEGGGEQWHIRTAGTHVTEGLAMSARTRDALLAIADLGEHRYGAHRSHQLADEDVTWADVILASEAGHVRFVRERFDHATHRVVQLGQFVRFAPRDLMLDDQLLVVARHEPDVSRDVIDPAGGDQNAYDECACQLWVLAQECAALRDSSDGD